MSRIRKSEDNLFPLPKGAFIRNKAYVYVNLNNKYIPASERKLDNNKKRGYIDHDSICIGVLQNPSDPSLKYFYANENYKEKFQIQNLPEPPKFSDSISVGLYAVIAKASEESGLIEDLIKVFNEEEVQQILDLSSYMLSQHSVVIEHYPAWARDHLIFSRNINSDTILGSFLRNNITASKIETFKYEWSKRNLQSDGKLFLCYDSTSVNSPPDGVAILENDQSQDDSTFVQVNTDYVIRQFDGLPITYLHSPGSVVDVIRSKDLFGFVSELKKRISSKVDLTLVCDRGSISNQTLKDLDQAKLGYILMLKNNFKKYEEFADLVIDQIKSYKNEIISSNEDHELYGLTQECTLYEGGSICYAQIYWSQERYHAKRSLIKNKIEQERKNLEEKIFSNSQKSFKLEDLKKIPSYFKLDLEKGDIIEETIKKNEDSQNEIQTYKILSYVDDEAQINREIKKAGIFVIITSDKLSAQETIIRYNKKDCMKNTLMALKSHYGMDSIGIFTSEAKNGKGLIWFVASILYALIFNKATSLRISEQKYYTVPAIVHELEAIKADRNFYDCTRKRRYALTYEQKDILSSWNITEADLDIIIADQTE